MTDKELLYLAAKACGFELLDCTCKKERKNSMTGKHWNPLTDANDRYELAKNLKFVIDFSDETVLYFCESKREWSYVEDMNISIDRMIVRAAAEIGKQK